jgi:tetratricopeptide (TPR) repeat protein
MENLYKLNQLSQLAQRCEDKGDYKSAEKLFFQLINLKSEMLGRNYSGCGTDLYNLGLLNFALGKYGRARRFLIRSLQIHKQELKTRRSDVTEALQTLAKLRREQNSQQQLTKVS